jgi:ribosomal protein L11 methyltransferase
VIRLALRVRREDAEIALAELLALAPGGVEEVDLGDRVEYAIYGAPGELPALPDLEAAAGDALVEVRTTEVADDWGERWKAFHEPSRWARPPALGPPLERRARGRHRHRPGPGRSAPAGTVRRACASSSARARPAARWSTPAAAPACSPSPRAPGLGAGRRAGLRPLAVDGDPRTRSVNE